MVPSQAESLHLKLFIVKCRTSEIGQGLLKQLRFYENVFELLKLGSLLVEENDKTTNMVHIHHIFNEFKLDPYTLLSGPSLAGRPSHEQSYKR